MTTSPVLRPNPDRAGTAATRSAAQRPAGRSSRRQFLRLFTTELRLFRREPQTVFFVFGFPVLTVLVLGGVFGSGTDDEGFELVNPQHWYTAAYFGVVLAAVATVMLPVHVAGYRERDILRRFDTSGFPRWLFPAVATAAGVTFAVLGFVALGITARLAFGIPDMVSPGRVVAGLVLATLAFASLGVAIGSLLPTARAAQGIGMLLFFPMFLLGGGGPPPEALDGAMRTISDWMPLTHAVRAIQEPWLGLGDGTDHLAVLAGILVASTGVWAWRSARVNRAD